ncbi:MAG: tetratricopeptide repeat protein [Nitrospirae bacterium]|nr:tetratricopeptide repeat protein [Nitrospirota bacterium]
MSKRVLVSSVLIIILGLLAVSFMALLRWQKSLEEKRISTYALGKSLYEEKKYPEAINQFKKVIEHYPQSEEARDASYRIALSFVGLESYKKAEDYFQKFLKDFPESNYADKVYYQLGWLEEKQGNSDKALQFYQKVLTDFSSKEMSAKAILGQGRIRAAKGEWKLAREAFQKVMDDFPESSSFLQARKALGNLNIKLIFSSAITDKKDSLAYKVEDGDSLYTIAKKFKTTIALLKKSNGLKSSVIRPGKTLKVTPGNFRIVVSKPEFTLSLYLNDRLIKVYSVGIGIEDYYTPTGEFKIINKLIDPDWYAPDGVYPYGDPKNVLGTRWMGISSPGYGIHGTTQPETVGKKSSQGCIRMFNKDVEELYDLVPPGTPVIIKE